MDRFVKRANIAHFERLLERTTDASRRQVILTLLAEEKQKNCCISDPSDFGIDAAGCAPTR
jgi:hypothetical protein